MSVLLLVLLLVGVLFAVIQNRQSSLKKDKLELLRAILPLCIIAHHLSYIDFLKEFRSWGPIVNAVFFAISGYGLAVSYRAKREEYLNGFLLKKVLRLMLPLLIVTSIYLICFNTDPIRTVFYDLIANGTSPLPYSWFVYVLMLMYVFFYIAYKYLPDYIRNISVVLLVIVYMVLAYGAGYNKIWFYSVVAFPAGLYYAEYETRISSLLKSRWILGFVSFFVICILAFTISVHQTITDYIYITALPLVIFMLLSRTDIQNLNTSVVTFLSRISFEVYLLQGFSMALLRNSKVFIQSDLLYVLGVYAITIVTAYLVNSIVRAINNKISLIVYQHENSTCR